MEQPIYKQKCKDVCQVDRRVAPLHKLQMKITKGFYYNNNGFSASCYVPQTVGGVWWECVAGGGGGWEVRVGGGVMGGAVGGMQGAGGGGGVWLPGRSRFVMGVH